MHSSKRSTFLRLRVQSLQVLRSKGSICKWVWKFACEKGYVGRMLCALVRVHVLLTGIYKYSYIVYNLNTRTYASTLVHIYLREIFVPTIIYIYVFLFTCMHIHTLICTSDLNCKRAKGYVWSICMCIKMLKMR